MPDAENPRVKTKILHRRGTEGERKSLSDILEEGEIFIQRDDNNQRKIFFGDGAVPLKSLCNSTATQQEVDKLHHELKIETKKFKRKIWTSAGPRKRRYM